MSPDETHMMEMFEELLGAAGEFGYCATVGFAALAAMYRKKCNALMEEMERYADKCAGKHDQEDPPEGSGGLEPDGGDDCNQRPAEEDVPRETSKSKEEEKVSALLAARVLEANRNYRVARSSRFRRRRKR